MCFTLSDDLKSWALIVLGSIGAFISLRTYFLSAKQRKIENTYKTLEYLRTHINKNQIDTFIRLFQANNELNGIAMDEFLFEDGHIETIEYMFAEGGCGNGDIHNMIELFNLMSPTLKKLEINIIWYEYGQIMNKIFQWTDYLEKKEENQSNKYEFYHFFNDFMKKNYHKLSSKPTKYYTYLE